MQTQIFFWKCGQSCTCTRIDGWGQKSITAYGDPDRHNAARKKTTWAKFPAVKISHSFCPAPSCYLLCSIISCTEPHYTKKSPLIRIIKHLSSVADISSVLSQYLPSPPCLLTAWVLSVTEKGYESILTAPHSSKVALAKTGERKTWQMGRQVLPTSSSSSAASLRAREGCKPGRTWRLALSFQAVRGKIYKMAVNLDLAHCDFLQNKLWQRIFLCTDKQTKFATNLSTKLRRLRSGKFSSSEESQHGSTSL